MKRFFSFLCAVALVFSATAAPQFKSFTPADQPKKLLTVQTAEKISAKKTAAPVKMAAKKQLLEQVSVRKAAKAPKAKQTVYNVTIGEYGSQNYGSGNIYYALISDDEVYRFDFDFYLEDATATDITAGVTYTMADLGDGYYSYITDQVMDEYYEYAAVSFLKTIVNDKVHFAVTITDTEGNTWNLTYTEPDVPQGGTYVADQVESKYYSSTGDVQYVLTATNDNLKFAFDIYVSANDKDVVSGQTYSIDDMDAQYTWGSYKGLSIVVDSASFTKTVAADGSYTIAAFVKDSLGNIWNLSASKAAPSVIHQTLTLNGFAKPGSSYSQIEAANADSTVLVSLLLYTNSLVGTFTEDDLMTIYSISYVLYDSVEYDIESADLTIAYSQQDSAYLVSGTLNCVDPEDEANQAVFTLALTCVGDAPAAQSDMTFQFQLTDSSIIIKPSNNDELWDWYMTDSATLAYYGAKYLASAIYSKYGTKYATSGEYEMMFEELYGQGYQAGEYNFLVWGCDSVGVTTPVATYVFTLPEQEFVSDMTFSFQLNDSSITVIPSDSDALWQCYLMDSATYSDQCGNNPDYVASVMYKKYGTKYAYKGSVSFSIEQFVQAGYKGSVIMIAWGCDSTQVTTKAAEYAFNMPKPEPQEFDITISTGVKYTDAIEKEGWWQIIGQNDTYLITLSNSGSVTKAEGIYTVADLDADYSYLKVLKTSEKIAFAEGSVTLAVSEDSITAIGAFKDADGNTYNINLTYKDPVADTIVSIDIPSGALYEKYAASGLYGFYGSAANGDYVQLAIWTSVLEGSFTEEDLDNQNIGSGLKIGGVQINIFKANITLAKQGNDLVLTAQLLCYNNTQYNVTMTIPGKEEQGIENAEVAGKATKRLVNGMLFIEQGDKIFNAQGILVR